MEDEQSHKLGPVILACRPRPLLDWYKQLYPESTSYVLFAGNILGVAFFSFLLATPILLLSQSLGFERPRVVLAISFIAIFCLGFWIFYFFPQRDFLILHQLGFRYRINGAIPSRQVDFSQVKSIAIGQENAGFMEQAARVVRPATCKVLEEIRRKSLNIGMKNGKTQLIEHILIRFDPDDTARFLTCLVENQSNLMEAARTTLSGFNDQ